MIEYVVGFLFNLSRSRVALIKKQRPEWQCGYLNGIGGHKEPGELPLEAMVRKFQEETGMLVESWREYCILYNDKYRVHFFETQKYFFLLLRLLLMNRSLFVGQIGFRII